MEIKTYSQNAVVDFQRQKKIKKRNDEDGLSSACLNIH